MRQQGCDHGHYNYNLMVANMANTLRSCIHKGICIQKKINNSS